MPEKQLVSVLAIFYHRDLPRFAFTGHCSPATGGRFRPKSTTRCKPRIPVAIAKTSKDNTTGSGCRFPSARRGLGTWLNGARRRGDAFL
jgi:hypothetical protein